MRSRKSHTRRSYAPDAPNVPYSAQNPRSELPTLIRLSSTQRATRACSTRSLSGTWAATNGSTRFTTCRHQ